MNAARIQHLKFSVPLAMAVTTLPFSIFLCHLSFAVLGLCWLTDGKWAEKWNLLRHNRIVIIFILFFLLHAAGIIYSEDKQAAWFAMEKKVFFFILPVILASIVLDPKLVRTLLHLFIFACLAATFICVAASFLKVQNAQLPFNFDAYSALSFYQANKGPQNAWMLFSYIELASGIGMHPSYLALYLVFCVLLIIHYHASGFSAYPLSQKVLMVVLLLYLSAFIICLSSRIMTLAYLAIGVYGIFQFLKKYDPWVRVVASLSFITMLSFALYLNPVSRFRNYQEMKGWPEVQPGLQTQSTTIRASLWTLGLKSIPDINWYFGAGTGDVGHLIQKTGDQLHLYNILGTHDPHNQYLQTFLGLGAAGLLTWLLCIFPPAISAFRVKDFFYVAFIFVFALLCLTETALELQKGIAFFSLFNSILLFQSVKAPPSP